MIFSWVTLFGTAMIGVLLGFAYGVGVGRAGERRRWASPSAVSVAQWHRQQALRNAQKGNE